MKVTSIPLVALILVCTTAVAQEFSVYTWVDDKGVPHYTDRPPNSAEATRTGIRSQRTDPNAVMARTEQRSEQFAAQNEARDKAGEAADEATAARQETVAERKANCEQAQDRAQKYDTARRLYRPMADGGREYLTDQELSDARAAANDAVNTWCK
jgi:catalase